jgi:hypothetical protein
MPGTLYAEWVVPKPIPQVETFAWEWTISNREVFYCVSNRVGPQWMRYDYEGKRRDHLGRDEEIRMNEGMGGGDLSQEGKSTYLVSEGHPLPEPPPGSFSRARDTLIEETTESTISFHPMRRRTPDTL